MNQETMESRLAEIKTELENMKFKQTYNFTSLVSRDVTIPSPADIVVNLTGNVSIGKVYFIPRGGRLLPLDISLRFRVPSDPSDANVLIAPNYNTNSCYTDINLLPPDPNTGIYTADTYYYTSVANTRSYQKFILTGFDDYEITIHNPF